MNRVTRKKNKDFTIISNVFLRDKSLSLKAKGFLAVIMGLPEEWEFTISGICEVLKEGKTAVYNTINELKELGYCDVEICRNERGMIEGNDYSFYENPNNDYPHTENLDMDNQPQLNTNSIKKEKKEKEDTKKDELFEECWKLYQRKGSKAVSKKEWAKLTDEERLKAKEHIPYYVSSQSEKTFQKDFQRYLKYKFFNNVVYKGNTTLFDPEQSNEIGEYRPRLDGFNLRWLESEKCYMTTFDFSMLVDGYTNENRPASAIVMYNGWKYKWNVESKKWERL